MSSEAEALRPITSKLVLRLQPDDIVDELYENKLLTRAEYEGLITDISQKSDQRGVNRRILMAVSKGPEGSVDTFAWILRRSQPDLATEVQKGKNTPCLNFRHYRQSHVIVVYLLNMSSV